MEVSTKRNMALLLAYDGTHYFGWQKTSQGESIEEEIEKALFSLVQHPCILQAASRTDRGVHAEGQWVNFFTSSTRYTREEWVKRLNALLPADIRILEVIEMPLSFHPTLHAVGKEYRYNIWQGSILPPPRRHYYWHIPTPLSITAMQEGAALLQGEHDFSSFCTFRKGLCYPHKRRQIFSIKIISHEEHALQIWVRGNHFLYKMVRTLVGTLVQIGRGRLSPDSLPAILAARSRAQAGATAPAHGLTLTRLFYSEPIEQAGH